MIEIGRSYCYFKGIGIDGKEQINLLCHLLSYPSLKMFVISLQ